MGSLTASRGILAFALSSIVLSACILLPDMDSDFPVESCTSSNPPASCNGYCYPSVQDGAPCGREGQVCTRQVLDCLWTAVCIDAVWSGQCDGDDAGADGAGGEGGGMATCDKLCGDAILNNTLVCEDSVASKALYDAMVDCFCNRGIMDPMPGCKDVCADDWCAAMAPSNDCVKCITSDFCGNELAACSNDI